MCHRYRSDSSHCELVVYNNHHNPPEHDNWTNNEDLGPSLENMAVPRKLLVAILVDGDFDVNVVYNSVFHDFHNFSCCCFCDVEHLFLFISKTSF